MGACLCLHPRDRVPGAGYAETQGATAASRPTVLRARAQNPHYSEPPTVNVPTPDYDYKTPIRIIARLPCCEKGVRRSARYTPGDSLYRGRGEGQPGAQAPATRFVFPSLDSVLSTSPLKP